MIPILFEGNETEFNHNGLGRIHDCGECIVTEERNGIYECDFSVPVTSEDFEQIRVGRIIGVTHDEGGDVQPFDIVSYERPINGIVTFHCTHISYRQSYLTAGQRSIWTLIEEKVRSLAEAFEYLGRATPTNPFTYITDKESTGLLPCVDGVPKTVRSILGGIEGSILDTYGGEYEWDRFNVILHDRRGTDRDFSIRYGVNMLDYNEEFDVSGTYMACVPYWTDGKYTVIGRVQTASNATITNRGECIPLDVSDKFESQPTPEEVEEMGKSVMESQNPTVPLQNIKVEFVRLQDAYEQAELASLMQCRLCDTVKVVFPSYGTSGRFKIVKTTWDVLADRYESMELGDLSVSLAEALGVGSDKPATAGDTAITTIVSKTLSNGIGAKTYISASDIDMTEQEGYKAVGIVGWSTNNWRVRPTTNYVKDNSTLYCGFANDTTDAVSNSVTIGFRVLWIK